MVRLHTRKSAALLLTLLIIFSFFAAFSRGGLTASANTASSSYVMSDLRKDESFAPALYPADENDYSLKVIQIAESTDGELLLYVYQPSGQARKFKATCINMAFTENVDDTHLYNLTFCNSSDVFFKYKVDGVTVDATAAERHYNITSIYRQWYSFDGDPGHGNTVSEVSFPVGQKWTAATRNGATVYTMTTTDVVKVTRKDAAYVRYPNGVNYNMSVGACDGHYVAFDTDHDIDKLLSAKIYFTTQAYNKSASGETVSDPEEQEVIIVDGQIAQNAPAIGGKPVKWDRIQTGKDFAATMPDNTPDKDRAEVATYQHVLSFYETTYEGQTGAFGWFVAGAVLTPWLIIPGIASMANASGTYVNDVSVLELTFEKDGAVYNMGTVDNKQTGSRDPINNADKGGLPIWAIVLIIIGVVLVVLVVLSIIFPPFGRVMLAILNGLWLVISAPVRLIMLIVRRIRERNTPAKAASSKRSRTSRRRKTSSKRSSARRKSRTRSKRK